jgi:protein O-GlcNAc transferase
MTSTIRLGVAALLLLACASTARRETQEHDVVANEARRHAADMLAAREFEDAVAVLEPLARESPKDDQVFVMLGDAYRGAGDFDRSVKAYEQAIRIVYGNYVPHLKLGVVLMEHGKTGRALTEFEVAVKYGGTDPLTHFNYGLALNDLGRKTAALEQWRLASEMEPDNAAFVAAVGIGLTGADDRAAVGYFERADSLGMDSAAFDNNYALALERTGDNDGAEYRFEAAVARGGPGQTEYRRNLARHYLRAGKNAEAAAEFDTLVAQDGHKWSDSVYLARARVALERYQDAIAGLETFALEVESGRIDRASGRVDRMPPTLGEALDVLGMAWRGQGDLARARDYLGRAVRLEPDDPARLNNYGVVLAESGMLPDARAQWRRVLEIDPANATARANLAAFGP